MSPAEARRMALIEFGGVQQTREEHRDVRRLRWILLRPLPFPDRDRLVIIGEDNLETGVRLLSRSNPAIASVADHLKARRTSVGEHPISQRNAWHMCE